MSLAVAVVVIPMVRLLGAESAVCIMVRLAVVRVVVPMLRLLGAGSAVLIMVRLAAIAVAVVVVPMVRLLGVWSAVLIRVRLAEAVVVVAMVKPLGVWSAVLVMVRFAHNLLLHNGSGARCKSQSSQSGPKVQEPELSVRRLSRLKSFAMSAVMSSCLARQDTNGICSIMIAASPREPASVA